MGNIIELREMSNIKVEEMLENSREELFNLRFQHAGARLADPFHIRKVRRQIAQLESLLHMRGLAIEAAVSEPEIAAALEGRKWDATAEYNYEDSAYVVNFTSDGSRVASAHVNLNSKRPKGRKQRETKQQPHLVVGYEIVATR
jgi:large subunit ribosomal protein L29